MIKKIKNLISQIYQIRNDQVISNIHQSELLIRTLLMGEKYRDSKNLTRFTYKSFSQFGEDGLITEIFTRIGTTNKYFVEFGVGNGLENNTCLQLVNNWSGLWIEGSSESSDFIKRKFAKYLESGKLKLKNSFITKDNIESLFTEQNVPAEFDLLSIDIDGNDYHIWKAIEKFSPRVFVVEYNASYGPPAANLVEYKHDFVWDGTNRFGASLKAFELLSTEKGYSLVGCDLAGINAFFVRNDLLKDYFQKPFTSEFHYEPPRYFLNYFGGHPPSVGIN